MIGLWITIGCELHIQLLLRAIDFEGRIACLERRREIVLIDTLGDDHRHERIGRHLGRDRHFDHFAVGLEIDHLRVEDATAFRGDQRAHLPLIGRRNQNLRHIAGRVFFLIGHQRDAIVVVLPPRHVFFARHPHIRRRRNLVAFIVSAARDHAILTTRGRRER